MRNLLFAKAEEEGSVTPKTPSSLDEERFASENSANMAGVVRHEEIDTEAVHSVTISSIGHVTRSLRGVLCFSPLPDVPSAARPFCPKRAPRNLTLRIPKVAFRL